MDAKNKINSFSDLLVWQKAHEFVLAVYKATNNFPTTERFGLINQMQRAAVSITSNIAEGFSRFGTADKINFYRISKGSTTELQNQLIISHDLEYLDFDSFESLFNQSVIILKMLNALITGTKEKYK